MYSVIEIENRSLASVHDANTKEEAVYLANKLMDDYLKGYGLTIEDVDPDDIKCASADHLNAFVDVYGANWDAYVIDHEDSK